MEAIAMVFRVGQKVVCVDDSPDQVGRPIVVVKGNVYTVSALVTDYWGEEGVLLVEVSPGVAPGWLTTRFRALVERKTDTGFAILTEILNGTRVPETA